MRLDDLIRDPVEIPEGLASEIAQHEDAVESEQVLALAVFLESRLAAVVLESIHFHGDPRGRQVNVGTILTPRDKTRSLIDHLGLAKSSHEGVVDHPLGSLIVGVRLPR